MNLEQRNGGGEACLVVVQARMGSSRLPNKVLMPLAGAPLLQRMLERVAAAKSDFALVVATTTDPRDQPLVELCARLGVACIAGHPTDLLDRHLAAARDYERRTGTQPTWVAKIPSDCPLIDPAAIDLVFAQRSDDWDFVTNLRPPTWPDGNDVELMRFGTLVAAHEEARATFQREHTTPFIWDQPQRFRVKNVLWERGEDYSASHRFTIDYHEDYEFIAAIYDRLYSATASTAASSFSLEQILALLDREPELLQINARHAGSSWHDQHLNELKTLKKQGGTQRFD